MIDMFNCFGTIHLFFILTTILFGLFLLLYIHRTNRLQKKIRQQSETIISTTKEFEQLKASTQSVLSPFIPETSRSIIISMDINGCIIDTNDYACEVFGYAKEEMLGQNVYGTIFPLPTGKQLFRNDIVHRIFANPKLFVEYETENVKKSGEHFWISWTNRVIYDDNGKPIEIRAVGFDITKRKRLEEELKYLASVDPLTGVLNRQAFLEAGLHEVKRAIRYARHLSVLLLKLDYYKKPNESITLTDELLRQVISIVRDTTRDSDYIGRIGDVEFAILLPETSASSTRSLEKRILKKIQEDNLKNEKKLFLTVHFGISELKSDEDTIDSLILKAINNLQTKNNIINKKEG